MASVLSSALPARRRLIQDVVQEMQEATPYTPPNTGIGADASALRKGGQWTARIGVALFSGPCWGMMGTVIGMIRAFNTLAAKGASSPETLAGDIGIVLYTTVIGISLGLMGAVLILIALFSARNREQWFFRWCVTLSVCWCLAIFPYGLMVGIPILILFIVKRSEFGDQTNAPQVAP